MKKEEKVVSIGTTIFWGETVAGIFWLGAGITGMFDNMVCHVLNILFLCAGLVSLAKVFKIYKTGDDSDEMAEYNYMKAKAKAGSALHRIICFMALGTTVGYALLQNLDISWPRVVSYLFFVLMGVHNILIGLYFRKLEAE